MNIASSTYHPTYSAVDTEVLDPEFFANMVHWDKCSPAGASFAQVEPSYPPTQEAIPEIEIPAPYGPPRAMLSVSTAFNAYNNPSPHQAPDVKLVSSDAVHFFVNTSLLRRASSNEFAGTLQVAACTPPTPDGELPCVYVLDSADVLNILVHTAYNVSPSSFKPSLETLRSAVRRMPTYGLDPQTYILPGTMLFETLRRQAALAPIKIYALASSYELLGLAKVASAYLLSYPLSSLSDQQAQDMGPTYLMRLFCLHLERIRILKNLLDAPPKFHAETADCRFAVQKGVARGWSAATRHLMLDAGPGIVSSTLQHRLGKFKDVVPCHQCKKAIDARIWQVVVGWTEAPATI